jgi:adenylosuccinate lyase
LDILLILYTSRLGIAISDEAIEQMKAHVVITDDDLEIARKEEAKRRHDVMGHVQYVRLLWKLRAGSVESRLTEYNAKC